jgi:hypothetical protein
MSNIIAQFIFYCGLGVFALLIYQSAILPNIRQSLRLDVFVLRDNLRSLAMRGVVKQDSPAFALLQDNLNFIAGNLFRFDLGNTYRYMSLPDGDSSAQVQEHIELMKTAGPEIRAIYERSLQVVTKALVFNSLFVFSLFALSVIPLISADSLVRKPFAIIKQKLKEKLRDEAQVAFFISTRVPA